MNNEETTTTVQLELEEDTLEGDLTLMDNAGGIILFAHGSGSSRHSSRNRFVAEQLWEAQLGTLLIDLLTPQEKVIDNRTRQYRFDIPMLADRLTGALDWLQRHPRAGEMPTGLFGSSTGAAAALITASRRPNRTQAVVSRGGRPDMAADALDEVQAPTLLIVGGEDVPVIPLNKEALARIPAAEKKIEIVPGATHLFEEPGALEKVAELARNWFQLHLLKGGR
jgi:pimeloyl-ACP methyl ester carboxylesterase